MTQVTLLYRTRRNNAVLILKQVPHKVFGAWNFELVLELWLPYCCSGGYSIFSNSFLVSFSTHLCSPTQNICTMKNVLAILFTLYLCALRCRPHGGYFRIRDDLPQTTIIQCHIQYTILLKSERLTFARSNEVAKLISIILLDYITYIYYCCDPKITN